MAPCAHGLWVQAVNWHSLPEKRGGHKQAQSSASLRENKKKKKTDKQTNKEETIRKLRRKSVLLGVGSQSLAIHITRPFTPRIQNEGHEQPCLRSQKQKPKTASECSTEWNTTGGIYSPKGCHSMLLYIQYMYHGNNDIQLNLIPVM